jgi:membrane-associated phospholipid phosphatase
MGALFLVVYGGTNWITSWRVEVGRLYFPWEQMLPFVPVLIIPYMSIDLFFVGAFFLCSTDEELRTLVRRSAFAILASGICFLLIPLQFAFERPAVSGFLGVMFDVLTAFDRPHNLFPSLHISLLAIVWAVYRNRTWGWLRLALDGWFALVAVSTLFTYQHHVLDLVGGALVALLAYHLFPKPATQLPRAKEGAWRCYMGLPNPPSRTSQRLGARYTLLAIMASLGACTAWPWTAILLWPATVLLVVALAYFGVGTGVFAKTRGRLATGTRLLLAPYLLGACLSLHYYRRGSPAHAEVVPGILLGRKLSEVESEDAIRIGVRAVLDLTAEYGESRTFLQLPYRNVQVLDLTAPRPDQLVEAIAFIREHRTRGKVYVHCALGYSRSACIVAAYLLAEGFAGSVKEAVGMIHRVRPGIVMPEGFVQALHRYSDALPDEAKPIRVAVPNARCRSPRWPSYVS